MRPIKQPANCVIAVGLAVAVIFGIWQMRSGEMLGTAGNSVANIVDQAPTDPLHSA